MMRISLPFTYSADVYTASRSRASRKYREVVEVDVPEVLAGDAPVALVCGGLTKQPFNNGGPRPPVEVRLVGDKLYEPLRISEWADGDYHLRFITSEQQFVRNFTSLLGNESYIATTDDVKIKGPPKKHTIIHTHGDEAREHVTGIASKFMLINGQLHMRVEEPIYIVKDGYVSLEEHVPMGEYANAFRLDEVDSAREWARLKRRRMNQARADEPIVMPELELRIPEIVKWEEANLAISCASREFEERVARELDTLPLDAILAWDDLRSARYPEQPDWNRRVEPSIPVIVDAMKKLCTALDQAGFEPDTVRLAQIAIALYGRRSALNLEPELDPSDEAALQM